MNQAIFNFMPQCATVEGLLNACLAALPYIPEPEKAVMKKALQEFEIFGAATMWSAADVSDPKEDTDEGTLTPHEKRETIARFIEEYGCAQADWDAIEKHAKDVLSERQICIRVDYDPLHSGGDYQGTPQSVFIPLSLVQAFSQKETGSDGVESAFGKHTKIDPMHIVGVVDLDVKYNQAGERIMGIEDERDGLTP